MKIKNVRKEYLVTIIFIVVAGAFLILFRADLTRFWYEFQLGDRCRNEKNFASRVLEGQLSVRFRSGISESEMTNQLESYGLEVLSIRGSTVYVRVPVGKERKWECIIREGKKDVVEAVEPIYKTWPLSAVD